MKDSGITMGDLIDAWMSNNSTDYFAGIDFTQFGAEPIEEELEQNCCPDGKKPSGVRKTWNFVADNIISKPLEGIEFFGYFFMV